MPALVSARSTCKKGFLLFRNPLIMERPALFGARFFFMNSRQTPSTFGFARMLASSESGMTLVSVMMDMGLLCLGAVALAQLLTLIQIQEIRANRQISADQAVEVAGGRLQALDFQQLLALCKARNIVDQSRPTICKTAAGLIRTSSGALAPGTEESIGQPKVIDLLYDWAGNPDPAGLVCAEMAECRRRANDRLLEVVVRATWADPGKTPARKAVGVPQSLTIRKAR